MRRSVSPSGLATAVGLALALAFSAGCMGSPPRSTPQRMSAPDASESDATARAIAALTRMTDFLGSQDVIRFEAETRYDAVQPSGQKIEFGSHRKIELRPRKHVRVDVAHWDGERELITFDGSRLSAALLGQRVYATLPFDGTTSEAFDYLVAEYRLQSPLFDLLHPDLPADIADRTTSARSLGPITLDGVACDHLAFRGERVDFQLYLRLGDEPVPIRLVVDYHAAPGSPQFRADLRGWDLRSDLPDSRFRLTPPPGAQRVSFPELLDLLLGPPEDEDATP